MAAESASTVHAARLYGAMDALRERSGIVFSPFYRQLNRQRIQVARERLTSQEWQAEYARGQQWNVETALLQVQQACGS